MLPCYHVTKKSRAVKPDSISRDLFLFRTFLAQPTGLKCRGAEQGSQYGDDESDDLYYRFLLSFFHTFFDLLTIEH